MQKRKLYWYCQFAGWLLYASFYFYINSVGYIDSAAAAVWYIVFILLSGVLITSFYRWTVLKLHWLQLPLQTLFISVLAAVVIMSVLMTAGNLFIERLTFPQFTQDVTFILLTRYFGSWLQVFLIYTFIYHLYIYYQKSIAAEKAKREAELSALTLQINPHFYFNTLHNLYGLAVLKSEKTAAAILKLSNIMEYVIYDCRWDKVPLSKEIAFIESYIELEKLRYDDATLHIAFTNQIYNQDLKIAPLLLIPFVENAFKHGAAHGLENAQITIKAITQNTTLFFEVTNSRKPTHHKAGIGLENVKKRLTFVYPAKHSLCINSSESEFSVQLTIVL